MTTSVTRQQVVETARGWLRTRYRHQGRLKGVSVDCVGLIMGVAKELGLKDVQVADYPRHADGSLRSRCEEHMQRITVTAAQAGDVLLFKWRNAETHLAFLTSDNSIIHAYMLNREVVEHHMNAVWRAHICGAYHIEGVE